MKQPKEMSGGGRRGGHSIIWRLLGEGTVMGMAGVTSYGFGGIEVSWSGEKSV